MTASVFSELGGASRVLMEAELRPIMGDRFQATGFPDLGPALYELHDGTQMLLVESAQSIANRLEAVCWDEAKNDVIEDLKGLPYVRVTLGQYGVTATFLEFHRLNSPYIWAGTADENADAFREAFKAEIGLGLGIPDTKKLAHGVFKYDPNSIVHGVFLEMLDGRLRLTRALSGFIEARNVREVESGGVKFDRVSPSGNLRPPGATQKEVKRLGHVPHHRLEFTAEKTTAYFSLDLDLLRSYGLGPDSTDLLLALSFLKIRRFLSCGLRLRTACDFKTINGLRVTGPEKFEVPDINELTSTVKAKIKVCSANKAFAHPPVTEIDRTLTLVQEEGTTVSSSQSGDEVDPSQLETDD